MSNVWIELDPIELYFYIVALTVLSYGISMLKHSSVPQNYVAFVNFYRLSCEI